MLEQVIDRNRQIVVRVHQPCRGDDAVTVIIRIICEGKVKLVAQRQQASHRALGGAVHADRAVFIQVHKAEGLIDMVVNDGQIQLVVLCNTFPVFDTGTAERVNAQLQTGFLDRRHIDDIRQPFNERLHQILLFHVAGGHRLVQGNALHTVQTGGQQGVGTIFHHFGDVGVSRATIRWVVFDAAIFRRVVGWRDHNTIGLRAAFLVVHQNCVRDRRGRRIAVVFLNHDVHAVGRQHFQYGNKCRL